jgi:hypothetical protein
MGTMSARPHQASEREIEYLARAGIPLVEDDIVRAECARVARRLGVTGRRAIGLIPLDDDACVAPIAIQLGIALMDLSGATIAYVDANTRWPALPVDAQARIESELGDTPFAIRWLFRSLALLVPRVAGGAGEAVPRLQSALSEGVELFKFMLVDLTGFDRLGERAAALGLLDGVIAIGHPGATREADVIALRDEVDPGQLIGALLVG